MARRDPLSLALAVSATVNLVVCGGLVAVASRRGGWRYVLVATGLRQRYRAHDQPLADRYADLPVQAGHTVFLGDSLTVQMPLLDLTTELHNRGIGGETVRDITARASAVSARRPGRVVLMAGTNDLLRGHPVERVAADIDALLGVCGPAEVVLLSVPPVNNRLRQQAVDPEPRVHDLNDRLRSLSSDRGVPFVDLTPALADPAGRLRAELTSDGVHLTGAAYVLLGPLLRTAALNPWPTMQPALASAAEAVRRSRDHVHPFSTSEGLTRDVRGGHSPGSSGDRHHSAVDDTTRAGLTWTDRTTSSDDGGGRA